MIKTEYDYNCGDYNYVKRDGKLNELTVRISLCEYRILITERERLKNEINMLADRCKTLEKDIEKRTSIDSTVELINRALKIKLSEWQINYIFENGIYHDEKNYGRRNGKTLANVLKFLFSSGLPVTYCQELHTFQPPDFSEFMREDTKTPIRTRIFIDEILRVYKALDEAGVKVPRKINFDEIS